MEKKLNSGILDHYAYRYDRMGNKTAIEKQRRGLSEESGLYTYGYDPLGRQNQLPPDPETKIRYTIDLTKGCHNLLQKEETGAAQPFGYTGYQSDRITGTDYAQAREYRAELGRFAGRDIIKDYTAAPYTLHEYGDCLGNSMVYVIVVAAFLLYGLASGVYDLQTALSVIDLK